MEVILSYERRAMLLNLFGLFVLLGSCVVFGLAWLGRPYTNQARIYSVLALTPLALGYLTLFVGYHIATRFKLAVWRQGSFVFYVPSIRKRRLKFEIPSTPDGLYLEIEHRDGMLGRRPSRARLLDESSRTVELFMIPFCPPDAAHQFEAWRAAHEQRAGSDPKTPQSGPR